MTFLLRPILILRQFAARLVYRSLEAIAYLLDSTRPQPNSLRVVIFAQGRTGSTLLESLLCSTGYFRPHGELLDTSRGEILFPLKFIRGLSKWNPKNNFVFHVKINHLIKNRQHPIDPALFLSALHQDGWKIIYLRRRNKVDHALSIYFGRNRSSRYLLNNWHKFDDSPEKLNISIECDKFTKTTAKLINYDAHEQKILQDIEHHEVVYEEDLAKSQFHQETVNKILNYLALEPKKASTKHRKVNNQSPKELVSNYEEFVGCLKKSGWEKFLE